MLQTAPPDGDSETRRCGRFNVALARNCDRSSQDARVDGAPDGSAVRFYFGDKSVLSPDGKFGANSTTFSIAVAARWRYPSVEQSEN